MADVVALADNSAIQEYDAGDRGPWWLDESVGYAAMHGDDGTNAKTIRIMKTTDKGASWAELDASNNPALNNSARGFATYGSPATDEVIQVATTSSGFCLFRLFDLSTETWGAQRTVNSGLAATSSSSAVMHAICIAASGRYYVGLQANTAGSGTHEAWLSDNLGVSWSNIADPYADGDFFWFAPDPLAADPDDIIGFKLATGTGVLSRVLYDASGDSWGSPSTITTLAGFPTVGHGFLDYKVRPSDGAIILWVWNDYDTATADLECWEITSSAITQLTSVVVNSDDCAWVGGFVDPNTDDLYCAYAGMSDGSETLEDTVTVFYKKSTDDGTTWGSETAYGVETDDIRTISAGSMIEGEAGRFMPFWFNDDTSEFRVNDGNDVEITVPAVAAAGNPHRMLLNVG